MRVSIHTHARCLPAPLVGAAIGAAAIALLIGAGLLIDRWPFGFDRSIILGLRAWGGPRWLRFAAIDVTALGSVTVLSLVVAAVTVVLLVQRLWLTALATVIACASVSWMIDLAKWEVARPRPTLVSHLVEADHASFPSGHAAGSAAIYLTLAALASQVTPDRRLRRALLVMAILLAGMIGCSRVYLGVHWPSDVLAGWSFGTIWALAWWLTTAGLRASVGGEP
ncbi:phosphatase PAP2 family protein [Sphingomonas bacterium]|uniref:phosphatase PAP2 family protein n=1 Tax=Sphingomonas bacterium TaxID=1895847 RepID=UPI0020C73C29|nr:phosphatase PAP2 family protein [Sphingomonas bacterium]